LAEAHRGSRKQTTYVIKDNAQFSGGCVRGGDEGDEGGGGGGGGELREIREKARGEQW
jgi:hypothetical protein